LKNRLLLRIVCTAGTRIRANSDLEGTTMLNCCRSIGLAATVAIVQVLVALTGPSAWAQTTKTIKFVVPFSSGGGGDILARLLAEQIGRAQGPTMIVENRPGAGSAIGTEAVSRSIPDGNTILLIANSFVINPHVKKLNYDPLTGFEPICYLVSQPMVIVVNSALPYRTLPDLFSAARNRPGETTLASFGPATAQHLAFETLKRVANVNITYVPYPGTAPAVNALLGEHISAVIAEYSAVAEQLKAGKLRVLATAARTRIEPLPDVPTIAESGYKGYEADIWDGLVAPAKTPKETVSQLGGWFTRALQVPEVKSKLVVQGFYPVGICGVDFGAHIRKQYEDYGRIIREAKIKPE
jgi:tripartite-type tricarboxylate transporter receptor subunit TctC